MSLYFVTGISSAGKSSLVLELRNRGYEAYDTDDDAFSKWQHKETGYVHPKSSVKAADRTAEFLANHAWNIPRAEVEDLAKRAAHKAIFLCGVADNEDALQDLFAKRYALILDAEGLTHRIETRTNNDWGKQPHELEFTLNALHKMTEYFMHSGHVLIDASQPIEKVADDIVGQL